MGSVVFLHCVVYLVRHGRKMSRVRGAHFGRASVLGAMGFRMRVTDMFRAVSLSSTTQFAMHVLREQTPQ